MNPKPPMWLLPGGLKILRCKYKPPGYYREGGWIPYMPLPKHELFNLIPVNTNFTGLTVWDVDLNRAREILSPLAPAVDPSLSPAYDIQIAAELFPGTGHRWLTTTQWHAVVLERRRRCNTTEMHERERVFRTNAEAIAAACNIIRCFPRP
jgi:hypothetical protein